MSEQGKLLDKTPIMKDYKNAVKLYQRYIKDKQNPKAGNLDIQKENLITALKDSLESLERISKAYEAAESDVEKEASSIGYKDPDSKGYLDELKRRLQEITIMKNDVEGKIEEPRQIEPEQKKNWERNSETVARLPDVKSEKANPILIQEALKQESWQVAASLIGKYLPEASENEKQDLYYNLIVSRIKLGDRLNANRFWLDFNEYLLPEDSKKLRKEIREMKGE